MRKTTPVDLEACGEVGTSPQIAACWAPRERADTGPTRAKVDGTFVMRLRNRVPEPTSIHWHGLRVPADMDGTELVQHPVRRVGVRAPLPTGG